jgi:hypothetical protein
METLQRDPVKIDLILGRPAEANVEDRRWGQLRLAESDLDAALIDRDQRLDLPTFAASEAQIEAIKPQSSIVEETGRPRNRTGCKRLTSQGFPSSFEQFVSTERTYPPSRRELGRKNLRPATSVALRRSDVRGTEVSNQLEFANRRSGPHNG